MKIRIAGTGLYLPPKIQKSEELAKMIDKSAEWIKKKSGVKERRVSSIDVDKMGAIAGRLALKAGNCEVPDLIINASGVPKQTLPDTSIFMQKEMDFKGIPSFSIHSTCLSFITAFHNASCLLNSGVYKHILIISSDRGTIGRNFNEPESASLLGDGAAAVLVERSEEHQNSELIHHLMKTWPEGCNLTEVRGGGTNKHPLDPQTSQDDNLFSMDGPAVYKIARKQVYKILLDTLKSSGVEKGEIDWVIPHQASGKAVDAFASVGGFDKKKVVDIIGKYGNCVAASVPMALSIAIEDQRIQRGDLILLIGTGAGLSTACALIRY